MLLVSLAAGCSGLRMDRPVIPQRDDWPTAGRTNSRLASTAGTLKPPLRQAWEVDLAAGFGSGSPLVIDTLVLTGNLRGELCAVNLRTGKKIGSIHLGDAVPGSPVVEGSIAYLPLTGSGESLVAFNLNEGKTAWRESHGDVEMSPLLKDRKLYFGTTGGEVYCLDCVTGAMVWKYEIPENTMFLGFRATPAALDSLVFFGDDGGILYAFSAATGSLRWRTPAGGGVAAGIAVAEGVVVAGTIGGTLLGCDASSGRVRWRYDAGAPLYAAPVGSGDTVYAGSLSGVVHAVRCTDGRGIWKTALEGPINAAALVSGDYLYVGTLKKHIVGLLRWDGSQIWSQDVDGRIKTAPAAAYGRLLVATDEHTMVCYVEGSQ